MFGILIEKINGFQFVSDIVLFWFVLFFFSLLIQHKICVKVHSIILFAFGSYSWFTRDCCCCWRFVCRWAHCALLIFYINILRRKNKRIYGFLHRKSQALQLLSFCQRFVIFFGRTCFLFCVCERKLFHLCLLYFLFLNCPKYSE